MLHLRLLVKSPVRYTIANLSEGAKKNKSCRECVHRRKKNTIPFLWAFVFPVVALFWLSTVEDVFAFFPFGLPPAVWPLVYSCGSMCMYDCIISEKKHGETPERFQ